MPAGLASKYTKSSENKNDLFSKKARQTSICVDYCNKWRNQLQIPMSASTEPPLVPTLFTERKKSTIATHCQRSCRLETGDYEDDSFRKKCITETLPCVCVIVVELTSRLIEHCNPPCLSVGLSRWACFFFFYGKRFSCLGFVERRSLWYNSVRGESDRKTSASLPCHPALSLIPPKELQSKWVNSLHLILHTSMMLLGLKEKKMNS